MGSEKVAPPSVERGEEDLAAVCAAGEEDLLPEDVDVLRVGGIED